VQHPLVHRFVAVGLFGAEIGLANNHFRALERVTTLTSRWAFE